MKKNVKKYVVNVFIILIMLLSINFIMSNNTVFAQINQSSPENEVYSNFMTFISKIGNVAMGALFIPLSTFMNAITGIIFLLLYFVFGSIGINGGGAFPFPDQIIFNKLAFFDPNFFNLPTFPGTNNVIKSAPISSMQTVIQSFYYSMFVIAGTIFIIEAMIIGIKLAVSSVAQEKAEYKEALGKWLIGILLLFTVHYLLVGMYTLNEKVVDMACTASENSNITFDINPLNLVPGAGNVLSKAEEGIFDALNGISNTFTGKNAVDITKAEWHMPGYGGLILKYATMAWGGDVIGSIICLIMLSQTIVLIFLYSKRLIYCIMLSIIAPVIVAADVIKKVKARGGKSVDLFGNWVVHITGSIFTQSFQAIFLLFTMKILSNLNTVAQTDSSVNDGLIAFVAIILMTAIIKFEKVIKQLFGIQDTLVGDMRGAAMKTMLGLKALGDIGNVIKEPFRDESNSAKRLKVLSTKLGVKPEDAGAKGYIDKEKYFNNRKPAEAEGAAANSPESKNAEEYYNDKASSADNEAKTTDSKTDNKVRTKDGNNQNVEKTNRDNTAAEEIRKNREIAKHEKDAAKIEEYNQELAKYNKNKWEKWANLGGSVAAVTMGVGMTDNVTDALATASIINKPIDFAVTTKARRMANKEAYESIKDPKKREEYNEKDVKNMLDKARKSWLNATVKSNPIYKVANGVKNRREQRRPDKVDDI